MMQMLSEDDLNLRELSHEERERAWDLWFSLIQVTNEADPPYTHGVFQLSRVPSAKLPLEVDTRQRRAEFLLSNASDADDYERAVATVRRMGLDPETIPHRKPA